MVSFHFGLVWFELVKIGLLWFELVKIGLVRLGEVRKGFVWHGLFLVWFTLVRLD